MSIQTPGDGLPECASIHSYKTDMSKLLEEGNKKFGKIEIKSNLFALAERSINPSLKREDFLPTLQVKKIRVKTRGI